MIHVELSYDSRNSNGLKVYSSDEPRERRCCGSCGNREFIGNCNSKCLIDNHHIGYLDCDFNWCRRWKRDRRWDNVQEPKDE